MGFELRHAASNSDANITTARMTHIMCFTNLAPDIQEVILFLPRVEAGPDTMKEIEVRRIAQVMDWGVQRERWRDSFATANGPERRKLASQVDSDKGATSIILISYELEQHVRSAQEIMAVSLKKNTCSAGDSHDC